MVIHHCELAGADFPPQTTIPPPFCLRMQIITSYNQGRYTVSPVQPTIVIFAVLRYTFMIDSSLLIQVWDPLYFCQNQYTKKLNPGMKKPVLIYVKNQNVNQLEQTDPPCFCYTVSTSPLLPKSEILSPLTIICGCTIRFVSDLVGNPDNRYPLD